MKEVKSDSFPRKKSFLLIPIHPTVSTFFRFWIILGSIAAIKNMANRATTMISLSMSMLLSFLSPLLSNEPVGKVTFLKIVSSAGSKIGNYFPSLKYSWPNNRA
jgi:hypothetical protein